MPIRASAVIVNWNGWRDTLDFLASLRKQNYGKLQTIVVDNAQAQSAGLAHAHARDCRECLRGWRSEEDVATLQDAQR